VIHGTHDTVISFWHGKKLYEVARVPKQFYIIKNTNHNNLVVIGGEKYWETISSFIKNNLAENGGGND
jgi:fermentation-respiration switch protein FrsA (DUF1100 family)